MFHKYLKFRLQRPEDDASGGGGATLPPDRGDTLEPPVVAKLEEKADPAGDAAAAALEAELTAAAAAKDDKGDDKGDKGEKADDKDTEGKPKAKDTRIPLSRHTEILNREREARKDLERQLAQFQSGSEIATVNETITKLEETVLAKEAEYTKLVADGKTDEATKVMADIRKAERQMGEAKGDLKIQAAEARAVERTRFNVALERIEASYPILNPDHEDYSQEKTDDVLDLKGAYELRGLTPTAAMQKAVTVLLGTNNSKQEMATTTKPRVNADEVDVEVKDGKAVAAARKAEAVKKIADVAQPANLKDVGADSDKHGGGKLDAKTVMGLSQAKFATLNEETLSDLRGDRL